MSNPPAAIPQQPVTRTSKSAITSLVCSLLVCIPFLMSGLAMLFGLIGFIKTGKPGVKGRWMAVVGGILGMITFAGQFIFVGSITAIILAALGMTEPVRVATHDFIRDLSTMNMTELQAHHGQFKEESLERLQTVVQNQGTFIDTTFTQSRINNDSGLVVGTAKFSKGTLKVEAELEKDAGTWKIISINLEP